MAPKARQCDLLSAAAKVYGSLVPDAGVRSSSRHLRAVSML